MVSITKRLVSPTNFGIRDHEVYVCSNNLSILEGILHSKTKTLGNESERNVGAKKWPKSYQDLYF